MLELYISYPLKIDFKDLRGKSRKYIDEKLKGKVTGKEDNSLPPPLKFIPPCVSLKDMKPIMIINQLNKILGVSEENAKKFYDMGVRSVEQLRKSCRKFDLNYIQLNGCCYYDDLICPISEEEEESWRDFFMDVIQELKFPVLSTVVRSRPNGIHSRLETFICIFDKDIKNSAQVIVDHISPHIPNNEAIMEAINRENYVRFKCIIYNNAFEKHIILDITIYDPSIHPYPILRDISGDLSKLGYELRDDSVWKDGNKLNYRKVLGRDNASSVEEIILL